MIDLSLPWDRQPEYAPRLSLEFPRPEFCFFAPSGLLEIAGGRRVGIAASGDRFRSTTHGLAYKVARATSGGLDYGTYQPITSDAFTIIVLANGGSADGLSTLFAQRSSLANTGQIDLILNSSNTASTRAGGFACYTSTSVAGHSTHSNSTSLVDGKFHVFAATKASATADPILWYDGATVAGTSTGASTTTLIHVSQKTRIGNLGDYTTDSAYCSSSDICIVLAFNGVRQDAAMQALTESLLAPYRIFEQEQIGIFPASLRGPYRRTAVSTFAAQTAGLVGAVQSGTISTATGSASGTSTVSGIGASIATATGTSTGASTVNGIGASESAATGTSSGTSSVNGLSGALSEGTGSSSGTSLAAATGASISAAVGVAAGTSTASAFAPTISASTGDSSGTSTCVGISAGGETDQVTAGGGNRPRGYINRYPRRKAHIEDANAVSADEVARQPEAPKELTAREKKLLRKQVERSLLSERGFDQLEGLLGELQRNAEIAELQAIEDAYLRLQSDEESLLLLFVI